MIFSRLAAPGWTGLCALGLLTACAADAGDASKSSTAGVTVTNQEAGASGNDGSPGTGVDSGAGGGGDAGGVSDFDTGMADSTATSNGDASGGGVDAPFADATAGADTSPPPEASVDTGPPPPLDAGPDCLKNIPASCPNCMTMNASDMPNCEKYIACYLANSCNPADACGSNDGVCGVNTIGGGSAPETAAEATYACACP